MLDVEPGAGNGSETEAPVVIVTAANRHFSDYAQATRDQCAKMGHLCIVYDLGDLGFGEPLRIPEHIAELFMKGGMADQGVVSRCPYKPFAIADAMLKCNADVLWLDADAYPVKHLDPFDGSFDIGVTTRRPSEWRNGPSMVEYDGLLNAGVVMAANTEAAWSFVKSWARTIPDHITKTDQEALNRLVLRATDCNPADVEKVFTDPDGCRIRLFSTEEYNYYYADRPIPDTTKIMHFKGTDKTEFWRCLA